MGRGHIRQRTGPKGDAWEVRVYAGVDPATGKDRRFTKTVRTSRADAERLLSKMLCDVDDGELGGPDAAFLTLCEQWLERKRDRWSPKTAMETAGIVRRHLKPALGPVPLRQLSAIRLDVFYAQLRRDGLQPATVRRVHGVVHAALEQAVRWDWLGRNPASRCEPIEGGSPEIVPPDPADVARLLKHLYETEAELALFVRLAAVTGRRRGELCALRWYDVNLDAPSVVVARTLVDSEHDGWVERPISKNRRRFPPLALDDRTVALLRSHRTATAAKLLAVGARLDDSSHVFTRLDRVGRQPAPWSPDAVSHRFARVRDALELTGVRLHDLRHHVATTLLAEGVATPTVAGRLGQGDGGRTTHRVYAHWVPASDRQAADVLARSIDQAGA